MSNFQELDNSIKKFNDLNKKLEDSLKLFNQWFEHSEKEYKIAIKNCNDKIDNLSQKENIVNKTQERLNEIIDLIDNVKNEISNLTKFKTELINTNEKMILNRFEEIKQNTIDLLDNFVNEQNIKLNEFKSYHSNSLESFKQNVISELSKLQNQFDNYRQFSDKRFKSYKIWIIILLILTMLGISFTLISQFR